MNTDKLIEAIEAKKYRPEQGIDSEMESFNHGLDAAIEILRDATHTPQPVSVKALVPAGFDMTDAEIRQWIVTCNHEPAKATLRHYLALRSSPQASDTISLEQTVAVKPLRDVIIAGIKDQGYGYTLKGDKLTVSSDEVFAVDIAKLAAFIRSSISSPVEGGTEKEEPHSDDLAVDRFAVAMKAKLAKKRAEGYGGWDDPEDCTIEELSLFLRDHVSKGDPVDVGNFAMMIHQRGGRIK